MIEENYRLREANPELAAELAAEQEKVRELNVGVELINDLYAKVKYQLAAAQLDNQRLREALLEQQCEYKPGSMGYNDIEKALSTPTDTAALDAYVAEKVAALTKQLGEVSGDWLLKVYENQKLIDLIKNGEKK